MTFADATIVRRASGGNVKIVGAERVAISTAMAIDVVAWREIAHVESQGNHVLMITDRGTFTVRGPLRSVITTLNVLGLLQIHRRMAVNADRVRRLIRPGGHRLFIVLDDQPRLDVGREYQRSVLDWFGATTPE